MAEVGKLSPSKITTYEGCSMAYYLKYIMHEKVPTNVRALFGKNIHYMLELFYDKNYKSDESFAKFWRYYWASNVSGDLLKGKAKKELRVKEFPYTRRNYETGQKEECSLRVGNHVNLGPEPVGVFFDYMKLGTNILKMFYNKHKNLSQPFVKEYSFGVKKDEPVEINGHLVRGVFDRIDKVDEEHIIRNKEIEKGYYLTDYKTDKSSPGGNSFILHRNIQFTLYSYVFEKLFGEKEKAILYYHLRTGKRFETHRSEKDYDYLKRTLDKVAEGIIKNKFEPFYGFHCSFCDYMPACEKYSMPYRGGPRIDLEGKIKPAKEFIGWDDDVPDWMDMQAEER